MKEYYAGEVYYTSLALQRGECRGVLLLCPLRQKTIHHRSLTFCRRIKMKTNIHKIIVMYGRDYTTHAPTQPEAMPLTTTAARPCGSDSLVFSYSTLFTHPGLPFSFQVLLNELHFSNHLKRKVKEMESTHCETPFRLIHLVRGRRLFNESHQLIAV